MQTQIIKDIEMLKKRYPYDSNLYKIEKNISEEDFKIKMQNFIKDKKLIKKVDIIDAKYYYDNNKKLEILDNGEMKCYNIKKLKYIKYDKTLKLTLYNERENHINYFDFKQNYEKVYKMKKIVFYDNYNNIIEFNVIVDENDNKNKIFVINFITKSLNYNNNITNILKLLNKND